MSSLAGEQLLQLQLRRETKLGVLKEKRFLVLGVAWRVAVDHVDHGLSWASVFFLLQCFQYGFLWWFHVLIGVCLGCWVVSEDGFLLSVLLIC